MKRNNQSNQSQRRATVACFLMAVLAIIFVSLMSSYALLETNQSSMRANSNVILDADNKPNNNLKGNNTKMADEGLYFLPGSLNLSRKETVNKCFVDPKKYAAHRNGNMCTYSADYDIFYFLLPKSGSSTGRHVMKNDFNAVEHSTHACKVFLETNRKVFGTSSEKTLLTVSMRNPLSRFYASYDEMFVRKMKQPQMIPKEYKAFMEPFWGWQYEQYEALFDNEVGVNKLTDAFERFVHDYDGANPFDAHLNLQMPMIVDNSGKAIPFDYIMDTKTMEQQFIDIAKRVGLSKVPAVIKGRAYPRRFNTSRLSNDTFRKMCSLSLIDFCCLNYEMPIECIDTTQPPSEMLNCKWTPIDGELYITDHHPSIIRQ